MSLYDKMRCANEKCGHPRYTHNGSHLKGYRTICLQVVGPTHRDKCTCMEFAEPDLEQKEK